jgi:hypothetical protein
MQVPKENLDVFFSKPKIFDKLQELVRPRKCLSHIADMTGRVARNRGKILNALSLKSFLYISMTKALLCILRAKAEMYR